jgi:glyceraldehyde-3-phosphate dehydrogenase (NADP+)
MYVAGQWVDGPRNVPVLNPFDGSTVDTVPLAGPDDVERALASAVRGARAMRALTGYERSKILRRAADLVEQRAEDFARTITLEEGKIIKEARAEVGRATETLTLSAEEAKRLAGEMIPLDGAPGAATWVRRWPPATASSSSRPPTRRCRR